MVDTPLNLSSFGDFSKGSFTINYSDKGLNEKIANAVKQFGNFRFEFGEIVRSLAKYNKSIFNLVGSGKYAPLSPKYAEWKLRNYGVKPILVLDGALRDSLIEPRGDINPNTIINITNTSMEYGTKLPFAAFVQEGTSKMPARPFHFIDEARRRIIDQIIDAGVKRRVDKINQGNIDE